MRRALISVSDKTGIVELAKVLVKHDVEIVSTGGTAKLLQQEGIPVTGISDVTGFPEIMDGRVKTLHPNIHGGLLAVRDNEKHMQAIEELGIKPIDLVVVNLYPFKETILKPGVTHDEAIENIDIGGPSMLRAAAKNYRDVIVLVDAVDYGLVVESLEKGQPISEDTRLALSAKVFRHTAAYDALVAQYMTRLTGEEFPESVTLTYEKEQDLRYGENPHQQAAFYREPAAGADTIAGAKQLHGKELSYNNINDANAALAIVKEFAEPAVVAIKHTNPCGVGIADTIHGAWQKAYEADPVSIFGGIIALNRVVDAATAQGMSELFLEIILAPGYEPEAFEILARKKNLRLMEAAIGETSEASKASKASSLLGAPRTSLKVEGGLLIQDLDRKVVTAEELQVVTRRQPTQEELKQLLFAWKVVKHVKSNAIVLARENRTVGVGAGQMNRVGAAKIAIEQAGDLAKGAVLASDAFFPMPDTVEAAAKAGITAIIQPGGSIKDNESIEAADRTGIAMVFTGVRHFKH
ncbi:bifunctional phosphoribosylaminoimidazolecarboxamide formyltransferase/IMP cyclohydrolase [Effusibacillus lacus]|uniref:Bifunctional purine biosynthesis protein PurH n=1 Tax=Effusibacillus lacus TaxID=1348429 RepID=A0A292YI43_9BACL|nr:bifunctional phosphoribosylaminoimidazolecarboxamide formyltransferase/IMP cyclohydrolase [Effusibacillus lacus]TCS74286.1 phosphoribosylaminoimidazolecarboxamide formyltransferase/IMP cyclohydrolase [Effusibacillus lacus]GAX88746.1 bifunctional phosphoribosylaminoimidazolecarboxamide formyltransferase/inosine monophosphate cyclohydrolase [Effusibacillus lacus]